MSEPAAITKPIGDQLKEGRLKRHLSLAECSKRTRIAVNYLNALEEEQWDSLPSVSHRLGFLRLYSQFLGVSYDELMRLYRDRQNLPVEKEENPKSRSTPTRGERIPGWEIGGWQRLAALGLVLLVVAWAVY